MRIATEDGSVGYKGFVTDILAQHLKEHRFDVVFACGQGPCYKGWRRPAVRLW